MDILLAIVALSLLIIVHEFGHYICAVATGMKVDRFSIFGIGPVVLRLGTWRGTEFVLSAIPFGAYVHIVGMEADDAPSVAEGGKPGETYDFDPNDPTLYRNRPVWARMLAILGGPAANYVAAIAIMFTTLAVVGDAVPTTMRVDALVEETAKASGLQPGDKLLKIADTDVTGARADDKVVAVNGQHKGETVAIVVDRGGAPQTVQVPLSAQGMMGIQMSPAETESRTLPVGAAAKAAVTWPYQVSVKQLTALKKWITGEVEGKMSGPVGIVREIAKSAERGFAAFLLFAAFISTLLGLFNLLPLPALDGGRFVFLLWEAIARRPANRRVEEMVHGIGMLALLGLILYVTVFNDLLNRS